MKKIFLYLAGFLLLFMSACQSDLSSEDSNDNDFNKLATIDFEISPVDAGKAFSHTPTGAVETEAIKTDFSCNEDLLFQTSDKDFIFVCYVKLTEGVQPVVNTRIYDYTYFVQQYGNSDSIRTLGQLVNSYKGFTQYRPLFVWMFSSASFPPFEGDYIYPTIEYLLAQACFQDDCNSQTRKAVLKMAIEKQSYKFESSRDSYNARKTGIFLMATILVKEKDSNFLKAA
jgi:hypothetical protein